MSAYKVKIISLKRRQDRRLRIKEVFKDIPFEFFDAIDGQNYQLTEKDLKFIEGNEYAKYGIHIPSLVCANYTHLNLLAQCANDVIPYFIFEDDVEFIKPIDFDFNQIAQKDLDVFWLMPNEPSILAYVVWPKGAKILIEWINKIGLSRGLDWQFNHIKNKGLIKEEELHNKYFTQIPGKDSDITQNEWYRPIDFNI